VETAAFDDPATMRRIVEAAEDTRVKMDALPRGENARLQFLAEVLASTEVVFAIWHDDNAPWGYGLLVLKGRAVIHDAIDRGVTDLRETAVIPCSSADQAAALQIAYGEAEGSA
jgi:hypothetical protein